MRPSHTLFLLLVGCAPRLAIVGAPANAEPFDVLRVSPVAGVSESECEVTLRRRAQAAGATHVGSIVHSCTQVEGLRVFRGSEGWQQVTEDACLAYCEAELFVARR